jgi:K+-sensing histidine kinase KdpD
MSTRAEDAVADQLGGLYAVHDRHPDIHQDDVGSESRRRFLPFARLDDRTRHEGFGLGLALVASITAVHGGTISASAVPTGGLDLTVALPSRVTNDRLSDEPRATALDAPE